MGHSILLSSFDDSLEDSLMKKIHTLVSNGNRTLGYIPSQYDATKHYFHKATPMLDKLGFKEYVYVDIDKDYDATLLRELVECDAIYLSGGNTFYFLNNLRNRGILTILRNFVKRGGILIGVSAGAMVQSPTIEAATLMDPNEVGLNHLEGLALVPFHFLPHYGVKSFDKSEAVGKLKGPICACTDGGGLILTGDGTLEMYGRVERWA